MLSYLDTLSLDGSMSGTIPTEMYVAFAGWYELALLSAVPGLVPGLATDCFSFIQLTHLASLSPCSGMLSDLNTLRLNGSMIGTIPTEMYVSFAGSYELNPELLLAVPGLVRCTAAGCFYTADASCFTFGLTILIASCLICGSLSHLNDLLLFGSCSGTIPTEVYVSLS
jgi:hypothetical protein